ncbi:MAG: Lrp/AsnC family transcriptional regulator [Nanoarchaeota archaeon]
MEESNKIKINVVDRKILASIEVDARLPITKIAKQARVSRTVAEYRLKQLEEKGIVRGYYPLFDPSKFGLMVWKLWVSLKSVKKDDRKKFFDFIGKDERVWWYAECTGIYDAVICVLAKNPHEFNKFFNNLQTEQGEIITDSAILINVSFEYHTRGFLLNNNSKLIGSSFQEKPEIQILSKDSLKIAKLLSSNARINYAELAEKSGKNVKTIKKIIGEFQKSGLIVYFRPSIDTSKMGYEYYKVLLHLHNPQGGILPSIVHWCRAQKNISAVISCVGPWQLELEVEVDTYRNLSSILNQLKDAFPDVIRSYETLLILKEGKFDLDLIDKLGKDD